MALREQDNRKLQKRNPEIIEDASFYQDLTYIALMKQIEKAASSGLSSIIIDRQLGINMRKYLINKGFVIIDLGNSSTAYHKLTW